MLGYGNTSKGIDVNKTNQSCKCVICNYPYSLKINFEFQAKVCDGSRDLKQKAMSLNDVAILSLKGNNVKINF